MGVVSGDCSSCVIGSLWCRVCAGDAFRKRLRRVSGSPRLSFVYCLHLCPCEADAGCGVVALGFAYVASWVDHRR